jgi:diguanylate cyclase (GGDEF)-like protein
MSNISSTSETKNKSLTKITGLVVVLLILTVWLAILLRMNEETSVLNVNYNDVVSEVFAIAFILLLLGVNMQIDAESKEGDIIYLGFCCMLVGYGHDLVDEFVNVEPAWILLVLENVMNNLGIVIVAIAVFKWASRYKEEVESLNQQKAILTDVSNTDPLTRLHNRRFLNNEFIQKLLAGNQSSIRTILLVDLDRFKSVNDSYGHSVGDRLIVHMANLIKDEIRDEDYAFRYGGEEFLVVLNCNREVGYKVAERIRKDFQDSEFEVEGQNLSKSTSIGLFEIPVGMSFEKAIDIADKALYKAKEDGRNRIVEGGRDL